MRLGPDNSVKACQTVPISAALLWFIFMLPVFMYICMCIVFDFIYFFLFAPTLASDGTSCRDTKRVAVPANAFLFRCRNRKHT